MRITQTRGRAGDDVVMTIENQYNALLRTGRFNRDAVVFCDQRLRATESGQHFVGHFLVITIANCFHFSNDLFDRNNL